MSSPGSTSAAAISLGTTLSFANATCNSPLKDCCAGSTPGTVIRTIPRMVSGATALPTYLPSLGHGPRVGALLAAPHPKPHEVARSRRHGLAAVGVRPQIGWSESVVKAGESRRDSVRVDLPQPLVADAEIVRNLVPDDVAYTFREVGLVAGQALDWLLENDDSVGKGHLVPTLPSG